LTAIQKKVTVNATQTAYQFTCGKVDLSLTFTSPLILNNLSLLSRPVSYINSKINSNDGALHEVQLYIGASTDIAANTSMQPITANKYTAKGLSILKAGTIAQSILEKKGDDLRIDWGYMYIAVPTSPSVQQSISNGDDLSNVFGKSSQDITEGKHLLLGTKVDLGKIGNTAKQQLLLVGYDDQYSVQYFTKNLRPWWHQKETDNIEQQLENAAKDYASTINKCEQTNKMIPQI
jgi:hypothetical protein